MNVWAILSESEPIKHNSISISGQQLRYLLEKTLEKLTQRNFKLTWALDEPTESLPKLCLHKLCIKLHYKKTDDAFSKMQVKNNKTFHKKKQTSICESNLKNDQLCYLTTDGAEIYKAVINQMCSSMFLFP